MKNTGVATDTKSVDGNPGAGTVDKMNLSADDMADQTTEYNTKKTQAGTDWARVGVLFTKWDSNAELKPEAALKKNFMDVIKLDADNGDISDAGAVDNKGGKGLDQGVGGWSAGCQIVNGGKNFYDFMYNATQYATETGQQRWYYSLIDIDSLGSDVKKGPPATTTTGTAPK
jgi:hypothetical protein